jgi:hypothetical protein
MKQHNNPRYCGPHSASSLFGFPTKKSMLHFKSLWQSCISAVLFAMLSSTAHADTTHQEFTAALQRWQAEGIHDYSFTLFKSCFCPGGQPMRITVRDDAVQNATNVRDGTAVEGKSMAKPLTMTEIFREIEEAYAKPADHVTLTINPDYGYPERVYIDYVAMMADEELNYTLTDFSH